LEDAIILEEGFAELLRTEEFDLLDDYAAARLSPEDAAAVEQHLLGSAESRQSLRIAQALQRLKGADGKLPLPPRVEAEPVSPVPQVSQVSQPAEVLPRSRGMTRGRWGTARVTRGAALIAACLVAIAFIPRWLTGMRAPNPTAPAKAVSNPVPSPELRPGAAPEVELPIITLVADVNRGAVPASPHIRAGATSIRLQAEVPGQAPDAPYSIRIQDSRGEQLFEGAKLSVHTAGPYRFVEIVVPTAALGPGERTVSLLGSDTASSGGASSPATFVWHLHITTTGLGQPK
jgi:hypothetical protein